MKRTRMSTAVWSELQAAEKAVLEPKEIEALLANSFDLESDQVQLLNWSPLH